MRKAIGFFAVTGLVFVAATPASARAPVKGTEADPAYWVRMPTGGDVARVYPDSSREGQTELSCKVDDQGGLTGCVVVEEVPVGRGFGEASLMLVPRFRMTLKTKSGQPTSGLTIRLPMKWQLGS